MFGKLFNLFKSKVPPFVMPSEDDLTVTESGLAYQILEAGNSYHPSPQETVTVRYAGWTMDGKFFDASYPGTASFILSRVVKGWTEGLQLVGEGGSIRLVIPPDLGYGTSGRPPKIGPNATLVFLVELVSIG